MADGVRRTTPKVDLWSPREPVHMCIAPSTSIMQEKENQKRMSYRAKLEKAGGNKS